MEEFVKKYISIVGLILLLLLSACGGTSEEDPTKQSKSPTEEAAPALPSVESPSEPGYPAPIAPDGYPGPQEPSSYPAPPVSTPVPFAYPAGTTFWMVHPAGLQCEEPLTYPELADAVAALEQNGVTIFETEAVNMMVCEACGCPTSEHYRINIDANNLDAAMMLGWIRE